MLLILNHWIGAFVLSSIHALANDDPPAVTIPHFRVLHSNEGSNSEVDVSAATPATGLHMYPAVR